MLKTEETWECIQFPKRSIKTLRVFNNGRYEHRRSGWMVQGFDNESAYGSEYEILEADIIKNFKQVI